MGEEQNRQSTRVEIVNFLDQDRAYCCQKEEYTTKRKGLRQRKVRGQDRQQIERRLMRDQLWNLVSASMAFYHTQLCRRCTKSVAKL